MNFNDKERLRILFREPQFFMDVEDKMTLAEDTIFVIEIDR